MRGVRGISQKHDVFVMPSLVPHKREVQPSDEIVPQQPALAQLVLEHVGKVLKCFRVSLPIKARVSPSSLAAFDDKGARGIVELVCVRNEQTRFVLAKDQRQTVKQLTGP